MIYRCSLCDNQADLPEPGPDFVAYVTCGTDDNLMIPDTDNQATQSRYLETTKALLRGTYYLLGGKRHNVPGGP